MRICDTPISHTLAALKGSLYVNKDGQDPTPEKQEAFHTLVLSAAGNETGVALEAAEDDTEAVLVSGEPLDQGVVQYGPFGTHH